MRHSQHISWIAIGLSLSLWSCASLPVTSLPMQTDLSPEAVELATPKQVELATEQGQHLPISARANLAGTWIDLEVAQTPQQQAMGLMHRPPLPDDRGMLFPFDPPRPVQFWMKNVPVPLDMVFLRNGEVVAIAPEVPPCSTLTCPVYGPASEVDQVIELRSGRAEEIGLQVGDRVTIEFFEPAE
mgnify:CR=1 FL=1